MSTFHRTKACWIGLLLLGLYSAPAWPQSASLVGHVYDNKDGSGIVGVDVTVTGSDGKVQPTKVSSTGGVFEVDGLTPGTAITVVFKKLGYCPYPKPDPVNLIGTQNQHDVFLYQDTEDLRYWDTLSHRVTSRIQAQGGDPTARSQRFVREWDKVDGAGLSVAAKVRAAQAFSQVKPSDIQVPAGLGAYASVDMQQLHAAQSEISTAVSQNGRLDPQKYHLPVAVWADVVAEEISQQKLTDLRTKELLYKVQNPSYAAQINTKLKR